MAVSNTKEDFDEAKSHSDNLLVVGIGASAGGIRALKDFFSAVRPASGMTYIVILHLSPNYESSLAEVLQTSSAIPISQVRERVRIKPDHGYVVSPNNKLTLADEFLDIAEISGAQERRVPVDLFFRALADARHAHAASVILSGTGADGSMGIKHVKECGGFCIAQDPAEAEFADMPRNAIATGLIDVVLPAADMPQRLADYRKHLVRSLRRPSPGDETPQVLTEIFTQLRLRTGHDFTSYKRSTVLRRIERRMAVRDLTELADYASYLRENREEAQALLKDLLISVTNFFRDPEAYTALEKHVIPRLFANKGPADHVRVWVAGCATGEEAYSIAMLLSEYAPDPVSGPAIQVFATDIDESALAKARTGLYTLNDAADVSPERLRQFFVVDGNAYRVRKELRELVLFAAHNVIKDPPFSHLDLITCRNLLIYLNRAAQERVLRLFHFGLIPGAFLFLGSSESADETSNLFVPLEKAPHMFQSRSVETPVMLPAVSATPKTLVAEANLSDSRLRERLSYQELHQRLLERYCPPSLVVNQDHEIVHLSDRVGRYLQFVGGEPSQNLLKVARPELRLELHSALYHATQHRTSTEVVSGPVHLNGDAERVKITVSPVYGENDTSRGMILVIFEPVGMEKGEAGQVVENDPAMEPIARRLEDELTRVKLQLRNTIEQHEIQQEELKASNEELQAMNEELRSSSEELETSKEELQSLNEELTTVNQELKIKIDELSQANNDTLNLINSTDLATVFIDRATRIKLFTPQARSLFNLMPSDAGRPLLDITHKLRYPEMAHDIDQVRDTLKIAEREVESVEGDWYIAKVLPYRTADDRISGVVLSFIDITERRRAEQACRESEERVRIVIESIPDFAIFTADPDGVITSWNPSAQDVFGYNDKEAIGRHLRLLYTESDQAAEVPENEMRTARDTGRAGDDRWHRHKDGTLFFASGVMAPLIKDGKMVGYTKIARDLTQLKKMQEDLFSAREELGLRVEERTAELAQANAAVRRQMAERVQSDEMRVRLLRQIVNVQEEERRRVSRELHDQLGQQVTALSLKLATVRSAPNLPQEARQELESIESIVKEIDNDVDFLVWELRPTGLDDLGLSDALADYLERWSKNFNTPVQTSINIPTRLRAEVETVLYRVAQEALNNIVKHAEAKSVTVAMHTTADHVHLDIVDDGVGFDAAAHRNGAALGLVGMRERAALVGGHVAVESHPGSGTIVSVRVPL